MAKQNVKPTVYAYGFDKLGFSMPSAPEDEGGMTFKFIGYSADASLDGADGIVIPSGVFEEFYRPNDLLGMSGQLKVQSDGDMIAAREKQLINALQNGAWVVFLLQSVDYGEFHQWPRTDLTKRFLNLFTTDVKSHEPNPHIECKADEFRKYLRRFGVAQTRLWPNEKSGSARVLAQEGPSTVGLEVNGQYFFLPFFTTKRDRAEVYETVRLAAVAVLDYKKKHDIYLPSWIEPLEFKTEERIRGEIQLTEEQLLKLSDELEKWKRYKAILCTSGQNLNAIVVTILRDYFDFELKSEEKFIEDAIIYTSTGEVKYVVEIKGINGGIKREHVNQVDSHRDRLGIAPEVAGLLIVNDFMDVDDFTRRQAKTCDPNNLEHAKKNNIKVFRAVTLFEFMRTVEEQTDKRDAFLALCERANPLIELG